MPRLAAIMELIPWAIGGGAIGILYRNYMDIIKIEARADLTDAEIAHIRYNLEEIREYHRQIADNIKKLFEEVSDNNE